MAMDCYMKHAAMMMGFKNLESRFQNLDEVKAKVRTTTAQIQKRGLGTDRQVGQYGGLPLREIVCPAQPHLLYSHWSTHYHTTHYHTTRIKYTEYKLQNTKYKLHIFYHNSCLVARQPLCSSSQTNTFKIQRKSRIQYTTRKYNKKQNCTSTPHLLNRHWATFNTGWCATF